MSKLDYILKLHNVLRLNWVLKPTSYYNQLRIRTYFVLVPNFALQPNFILNANVGIKAFFIANCVLLYILATQKQWRQQCYATAKFNLKHIESEDGDLTSEVKWSAMNGYHSYGRHHGDDTDDDDDRETQERWSTHTWSTYWCGTYSAILLGNLTQQSYSQSYSQYNFATHLIQLSLRNSSNSYTSHTCTLLPFPVSLKVILLIHFFTFTLLMQDVSCKYHFASYFILHTL